MKGSVQGHAAEFSLQWDSNPGHCDPKSVLLKHVYCYVHVARDGIEIILGLNFILYIWTKLSSITCQKVMIKNKISTNNLQLQLIY